MEKPRQFSETITIRNLKDTDFRALLEMYQHFQPKNYIMGLPPPIEPLQVEWLKNLLHEKLNIIATDGVKVVGHAAIIDVPGADFCELIIFVHQDYRGIGLGKKLTEAICQRALILGKKKIWLMVESKNTIAIKIYYNIGFRVTKMYGDVYEMELDMDTPAESLSL